MGYTEVNTLDADNVIALGGSNRKTGKKNPQQVEGYYLGSRQVESKKSKNGKAYIHFFQTSKGNVGVWGKTDLDRKLLTAPLGTMVRATHVGMQATPNGEMYKYKVELDKENTIEVSFSETTSSDNGYEEETSSDEYNSDDETSMNAGSYSDSDDQEDEVVEPVQLPRGNKSSNSKRVEELLNRGKAKN